MPDILFAILALAGLAVLALLIVRLAVQGTAIRKQPEELARVLEERHRAMLTDLHGGLAQQSDRLTARLSDELNQTRETLHRLQLSLAGNLGETTEKLGARIDQRLEQIAGKVNERLEEGFKKTNETFVNVMQRLATIDEAQKKIETLTGSVVSLQELLGDKRSRGAFGEVQLEALVRNVLPNQAFEMQYTLSNGMRVDCVLKLPAPTGLVCVDSKFPLENYKLMLDPKANEADRAIAQKAFRADVRRHVDAIASKYIIDNETSDAAVMFVPAEAVFAEIHAYHSEVVDYAIGKRGWIVSPSSSRRRRRGSRRSNSPCNGSARGAARGYSGDPTSTRASGARCSTAIPSPARCRERSAPGCASRWCCSCTQNPSSARAASRCVMKCACASPRRPVCSP